MAAMNRPLRMLGVALATLAGNLAWVVATLFFGLVASVVGWLPPRGNWMFLCARWWSRILLASSFVRVRRELAAPLDPRGRYVLMANHLSMYDIPVLFATLPGQTRFMAKRSLFKIPIFGWALWAGGFLPVDREDRSRAREMLVSAEKRLAAGTSVMLFPEETRSRDGRVLPLQRGGFLLALKSGLPIVPVGIDGTREVRPRGSLWIHPRQVVVRYGAPVDVTGMGLRDRRTLQQRVRAEIAALANAELAPDPAAAAANDDGPAARGGPAPTEPADPK
jgi:1-acyl-sn-glycerol-3-phosphate acyltransferase